MMSKKLKLNKDGEWEFSKEQTIYRLSTRDLEAVLNDKFTKEQIKELAENYTEDQIVSIVSNAICIDWVEYIEAAVSSRL